MYFYFILSTLLQKTWRHPKRIVTPSGETLETETPVKRKFVTKQELSLISLLTNVTVVRIRCNQVIPHQYSWHYSSTQIILQWLHTQLAQATSSKRKKQSRAMVCVAKRADSASQLYSMAWRYSVRNANSLQQCKSSDHKPVSHNSAKSAHFHYCDVS